MTKQPATSLTFFTSHAQLTFDLSKVCTEVNAAELFLQWFEQSSKSLANFTLLPFDPETGQQITTPSQIATNDVDFFSKYYFNHRLVYLGHLSRIKDPCFCWLNDYKVFLNYTKFKTDTLGVCSFLVGAHPGHLHCDEVEEELRDHLHLDSSPLKFHLSSRSISGPIQEGEPSWFSF